MVELVMTWPTVKCLVENHLCDRNGLNVHSLSKHIYWLLLTIKLYFGLGLK